VCVWSPSASKEDRPKSARNNLSAPNKGATTAHYCSTNTIKVSNWPVAAISLSTLFRAAKDDESQGSVARIGFGRRLVSAVCSKERLVILAAGTAPAAGVGGVEAAPISSFPTNRRRMAARQRFLVTVDPLVSRALAATQSHDVLAYPRYKLFI